VAATDPLNNTTNGTDAHHHINSQINVPNIETLIPLNINAKNYTQKKLDSNLFTLYRANQQQKKKNSTNRFDSATLNNSLVSNGGPQDYTPIM